jgi:ubiquitin-activating enzyme E1 C
VIAAACVSEAFKIATKGCVQSMGDGPNYMQFNGTEGLYVFTFEYERKPDCVVCSQKPRPFSIGRGDTVGEVISKITADPTLQLKVRAAAVASCLAAVLTEIYLCGICSCQEILRRNGRGQAAATRRSQR